MSNFKQFAIELVKKAGKITKKEFYKTKNIGWKKGKQILTKTDIKINELMNETIEKKFPNHNIISEELPEINKNSEYTWYVDPIDGTIAFAQGIPYFCNVLALKKNKNIILSVVYDPIHDELFVAEKNKGTYLNNNKIISKSRDKIQDAYFYIGIWKESYYKLMPLLCELNKKMWCGFPKESCILSACYSACSRMDGAIFTHNTPWDIAPQALITSEAGLKVTDLWGNPVENSGYTKGIIIAKPELHKQILKMTKKYLEK